MNILIFKTNIRFKKDLKTVARIMNTIPAVNVWNVDREDVDKVLRIETSLNDHGVFINTMTRAGYACEVLTD